MEIARSYTSTWPKDLRADNDYDTTEAVTVSKACCACLA